MRTAASRPAAEGVGSTAAVGFRLEVAASTALGVSVEVQRRACHAAVRALADGGLGAGEVTGGAVPGDAAGVVARRVEPSAPAPSSLDAVSPDNTQGVRVGKASFRPDPKGGSKK